MTERMKLKAGPPRCPVCGAIKEMWVRKFKPRKGFIWICPNLCDFRETNEEKDDEMP